MKTYCPALRKIYMLEGHWLGCLIARTNRWTAQIATPSSNDCHLVVKTKYRETTVDLFDVHQVTLNSGWFFSTITLNGRLGSTVLSGFSKFQAQSAVNVLRLQIIKEVGRRLEKIGEPLEQISKHIENFLAQDQYLRHSDVTRLKATVSRMSDAKTANILELIDHPYAQHTDQALALRQKVVRFYEALRPQSELLQQRNNAFVDMELDNYRTFFDAVEKTPLTDEQRRAAVIFEDRNLLVAAAGSGKSSTLVGKAGYAIKRGLFQPQEILALAFNRDAALELNKRINVRIKPWLNGKTVKAHTFHGLGTALVRKVAHSQGRKVRVAPEIEEKNRLQAVLNELIQSESFLSDWVVLLSLCREPIPDDGAFSSLEDYNRYVDQQRKSKRNGGSAAFQTLAGPIVRSAEELAIANWLYVQGVPFEYERPFDPLPDGWDKYQPDFYYPEINSWHEHFALNSKGEAPPHFRDYKRDADFKREWLSAHTKGQWFETLSHQHRDGRLFEELRKSLIKQGQKFRPRTSAEILACIQRLGQADILDLILQVLHLVKANCITPANFEECIKIVRDTQRAHQFSKIFWPLYNDYNRRLSKEGKIDFDDMIVQAAEHLEQGQAVSPYKLILVDEFQDLSPGRARLVKALLSSNSDSILFGVGDDWQSINGFAGSDLSLFMDFQSTFGPTHEGSLTKTFRSAQGIADVGAFFIQKNTKGQKAKQVTSELDKTINGVVDLLDVDKDESVVVELEGQFTELAANYLAQHGGMPTAKKTTVFLLSRYGLSKTAGITQWWLDNAKERFGHALDIEFITMHKSKGLEADYVFLLGLNAGWGLTFPSSMTNDPLVDMLLTQRDPFPHAEERRLFYVALTRARKRATVLFQKLNPSPFVLELMESEYRERVTLRRGELPGRCNACGKGFMVPKSGPYSPFLGCTRYNSNGGCTNKIKIPKLD